MRFALIGAGAIGIKGLVDREIAGRPEQDRVPVRLRLTDRLRGDLRIGARPIFHDHRLAEPLGHFWRDQPRQDVDAAAGRKSDDDAHRPARKRLGARRA